MDEVTTTAGPRLTAALGGMGGALLLAVAMSPDSNAGGLAPFLGLVDIGGFHGEGWALPITTVAVTGLGLGLTRFWPYLLVAAGLVSIAPVLLEPPFAPASEPFPLYVAGEVRGPLALIGVLACAQGLVRRGASGWGSAVAGLSIGAAVLGTALLGPIWVSSAGLKDDHLAMLVIGVLAQAPVLRARPRGEPAVAGPWWSRVRLPLTGMLAVAAVIPFGLLSTDQLSRLLGVGAEQLQRHPLAVEGVFGAFLLVTTLILALVAGLWSFGGVLTVAITHTAVVAPLLLAITGLGLQPTTCWLATLTGIAIGAGVAAGRWRIPGAAGLAVGASVALFIAYAATGGWPQKLADQSEVVPSAVILVLVAAAATAITGATAPVLAPRGALPAALGPLATMLGTGGIAAVATTYLGSNGEPESSFLKPVQHLNTAAILLLVAAAAIGGLGLADLLAARRADRKRTEQIRQEAAAAERDRLARPIHDGVLQVLALVQRHGSEMGGPGPELAELAGAQEVALRNLLSGRTAGGGSAREDLRTVLMSLASPAIDVAAPAEPVMLPARAAGELSAAVLAALDNVRRHAGPGARVWILLEDERDGVRVTVRDDGAGFGPDRLAEAAARGRLGVAQSMRGRITDLGGTTTIDSRPGEGTEVEFWVPRSHRVTAWRSRKG
jgi:signal transduction histidine kinase